MISVDTLTEKYLKPGEKNVEDLYRRVATFLASKEADGQRDHWASEFLENMRAGGIGAGRIMSSAGTGLQATLINCFVEPVGDAVSHFDDDGYPGIYEALKQAAETMRRGGGVGYDFSRIRPCGSYVKGTASNASGPCSYIDIFDASCKTVESAGARRGAQMGVLRIDHPDVLEFITAKRTQGRWNNFNVSVGISEEFMQAVFGGKSWDLVHKASPNDTLKAAGAFLRSDGKWVYRSMPAVDLWNTIMKSTYDYAEPGVLFLDNINAANNLRYCEQIAASNPCGEQPLPSYGCCDLGPVILTRFVKNPFGLTGSPYFDFDAFEDVVATQVRMLDNVLDVTVWPLPEQEQEANNKRRVGVGFTGMGDALIMMCLPYNTAQGRSFAESVAISMKNAAYFASVELAKERGAFPLFDADKYLEDGTFASTLDESLKAKIREHGIRNSHLLSIAPTGTVSLAFADNASNGIEPAFSWTYQRKKRAANGGHSIYDVEDYAYRLYRHLGGDVSKLPDYFVTALSMSATDHIAMMEVVQPHVDSAISKTINVAEDYDFEDFKGLYLKAWKAKLKGVATYRPNSTLGAVLIAPSASTEQKDQVPDLAPAVVVDPMRQMIERRPAGSLPAVAEKIEYITQHDGKKTLYLLVSFLPVEGKSGEKHLRAIEFFMPVGQSAVSQQWISSSMRLLSLAARGGFLERALDDMRKVTWDRGPVRLGRYVKEDGGSVPMFHDSEVAAIAYQIQQIIAEHHILFNLNSGESEETSAAIKPVAKAEPAVTHGLMAGKKCFECGAHAVVRRDGCDKCTNCGMLGACG
ncbi:putative ribonucleoside-diphosphate reductase [Rhodoferax antarcticus ANT.BR]|uniref:Vitamin B12-dependent ribonucleotide reductase n=1 Tax=Rhodoferax antarcticus ANT.BR TaxID=1111071 RepID=A0A1Q8Y8S4_9BURK|nr:putative ribonucleoside-diphosphate reductase [Rhodoferax antarcticus ANT.BR]